MAIISMLTVLQLVKRYWVCTKTLFKTVVSGHFIYWVIN